MAVRIQFRRGDNSAWNAANPVLASGELGYVTDKQQLKFGDGATRWVDLPLAVAGDITSVKAGNGLIYSSETDGYGSASVGLHGDIKLEIDTTKVVTTTAFDSAGDTLVGTGDNTYSILHVGDNGKSLIADSTQSLGVKWGTPVDPTISNGYISNLMLGTNSVITEKINNSAVITEKINNSAVTTEKINNSAVTTEKINNSAVTTEKINNSAVVTEKINNGAVTAEKIASNIIGPTKLEPTVYYRATTIASGGSAKIFIQPTSSPAPTGAPGDIWFAYE